MEQLKNFIDNYLSVNKKITLSILTIEHNSKRNIELFLNQLKVKLNFDYYEISRKENQTTTVTTIVFLIKGFHMEEYIKNLIGSSVRLFNNVKPEESLFMLHHDIYVDDLDIINPLSQIQTSFAVLIVKEHLKIKRIN